MKPIQFHGLVRSGPKGKLSPTLGDLCPVCLRPLVVGDFTTLMTAGASSEMHWQCAVLVVTRVEPGVCR